MGIRWAIAVVLAGCHFHPPAAGDDVPPADTPVDNIVITSCTPGTTLCSGPAKIGTCNAAGDGIDTATETDCLLACVDDPAPHCVAASNLAEQAQMECLATTPPDLTPIGGTVTIGGNGSITCTPNCGSIPEIDTFTQVGGPSIRYYCLGTVTIPSGVMLSATPTLTTGVLWFAKGAVTIDGEIRFDGEDAQVSGATRGGPGGSGGAVASANDADGPPAPGACGGFGGIAGATPAKDGGGGGGGAHLGAGGAGGDGLSNVGATVAGAPGITGGCGVAALVPLTGGFGGGSGGDGECAGTSRCGLPGGGGGGALQIASRAGISIGGVIQLQGGNGFGNGTTVLLHGGAGGGGAGGGLLLEAPSVTIGGNARLDVAGGSGGPSGAGLGGAGATVTVFGDPGTDAAANDQGGAGGGGGAGVIRVNAPGDGCMQAVPATACTSGVAPAQSSKRTTASSSRR